jgi:predicted phosphodiesterase
MSRKLTDLRAKIEASPKFQQGIVARAAVRDHLESIAVNSHVKVPSDHVRVAVFSDTHHGSLYHNAEAYAAYAAECRKEGVEFAVHAGDVLEGHRLYRGQEFEVAELGWEAQLNAFDAGAPDFGCPVRFIAGNHDISYLRAAGVHVGVALAAKRSSWVFLGQTQGTVNIEAPAGKFSIKLLHPGGGSAYALSYRPQKIVEQLEGGTKPDMLVIGNYHKSEWIPSYRNVSVVQGGCFQHQTNFMIEKGISAHVGGWIFDLAFGKGCVSQKARWIGFP